MNAFEVKSILRSHLWIAQVWAVSEAQAHYQTKM